ncbi:MAG TPA: crosslink repair DNA glycosylase YcaQ family protein, partial [Dehalococcoidia bacterium]|nr:crosslink repair DNA glycosylase YcaQ family protein [Dehalococcoidia bacterium]
SRRLERDEALAELATRYFTSHGPATIADFTWWSGLTVREAREAIDLAAGRLAHDTIAGQTYYLGATSPAPRSGRRRADLLPPFDEYTVAYKDRSAVLDPAFAGEAIAGGMFRPMIVVGGQVAGTWKRTVQKGEVTVALSPFRDFSEAERDAIPAAATRYGRFLGLRVTVER